MSDRSGNQGNQPPPDDGDNLDYLDAGLPENDESGAQRTEAIDEPVAAPPRVEPQPAIVVTPPPPRDTSWTWPLISAAGLAVVIAVNYLANWLEFNGQSTGDVVNKDPVPFQPAGWVFSIWGLIYLLLIAFVIYGLLPAGRHNTRLQRISPFFLLANVANVTWIVLWHWEQFLASLFTILVLLGALLFIYIGLRIRNPMRRTGPETKPGWVRRLVLWVPFSVYLGWICVAALSNLMVWLDRSGRGGGPFSLDVWAVIFMAVASLAAAAFMATTRDVLIPLVMAVAFVGIAHHNWGDATLVSIAAIVFAVVCVGISGVASVLGFDRNANRGPFGTPKRTDTPPPMSPVD